MTSQTFPSDVSSPEMRRAVSMARESFRIFWRELSWEYRRIVPGLEMSAIKVPFSDQGDVTTGSDVEHMWLSDVSFDGAEISATVLNTPNGLRSVAEGDQVQVSISDITDWLYVMDGKAYGAFSVNAMRAAMGKAERADHDAAWGINFGEPATIRYVPPSHGVKARKSGIGGRLFGKAVGGSQELAQVTAVEHPMAVNMLEKLEEFAANPDNLSMTGDDGLTYLHSMALAGGARAVDVLMRAGADGTARTARGLTAYALAENMGWPDVMRVLAEHLQ